MTYKTADGEEKEFPNPVEEEENLPVPVDVDNGDGSIFRTLDGLDDELIKAELENRITKVWVYSFKQGGKTITGLSKVGVDAACTEMAKSGHIIEEGLVEHQMDPTDENFVLFKVTASRYLVNLDTGQRIKMETVNGTKRQGVKMKAKGKWIGDPFWYEKGAMKAVRNARSRLIPDEVKATITTLAQGKGRVRTVTSDDHKPEPKDNPPETGPSYAVGKDKKFVEAWVKKNCNGDRESFKLWASQFPTPMVDKDNDGKLSMNMVNMRFVARLRSHSDDAAESYGTWYEHSRKPVTPSEAAEVLEGEVVDG
jgi:hypothetical protein